MPSIQELQDYLSGTINANRNNGAVNWGNAYGDISNYIKSNRIDPNLVAQAAQGLPGGQGWDASRVRSTMAEFPGQQYGLNPALMNLSGASMDAQNILGGTQSRVSDLFKQGMTYLNPYTQTGTQANQLQAALSGALGPEAQQQAFNQYQSSPGFQFALDQSEKALTRNAAALGGLGGGNIRDALSRNAIGYAQQDYGNQFNRLGQVADRGFSASSQAANFGPQEASIQANLGQSMARIPLETAALGAGYQMQAGNQLSQNVGSVTSALANLQNQQGAGTADLMSQQVQGLNTLYQNAANGDANAQQQLAQLLANVNMQGAGAYAGTPTTPMTSTNQLGQLGQLAGGVGGLLAGLKPVNAAPGQNAQPSGANYGSYNFNVPNFTLSGL